MLLEVVTHLAKQPEDIGPNMRDGVLGAIGTPDFADEVGLGHDQSRVAREALRETDDKLKAIERKVREAEQEHWRKSDPATKARTNDVVTKIEESIAKLQTELSAATASKDAKKIADAKSAIEAREAWLKVVIASSN